MKKKGFTLIELLAVIVILAVIALIAVPTILNVIEKSRKGAAEQSALGYIDAIEKQVAINELDETKTNITDGVYDVPLDSTYGITIKGEAPKEGWVEIEKGIVTKYSLKFGKYVISFDGTNKKVEKGENALEKPEESSTTGRPTSETPSGVQYTGVKRIVYLDPTDLTKTCTSSNINSDTETKTGCMKWYAYAEDDTTYTMILDHNTTATVAWNSSGDNAYMGEVKMQLESDTIEWDDSLNSRLITANEVATIVGNTDWDSFISNSKWFSFLDFSQDYNSGKNCASDGCKYAWLYDRTKNCTTYGCLNDASGTDVDGYWTSSYNVDSTKIAWHVYFRGSLNTSYVHSNSYFGVRPVITVLKSKIS